MTTINRLEIEISASAEKAEKALDRLVNKLDTLSNSLGRISGSSITEFSNSLRTLSDAMNRFNETKVTTSTFTNIAKGVSSLTQIDATKISQIGHSLTEFAYNLQQLSGISFNIESFSNLVSAISKLGGSSVTQATANLPIISKDLKNFITDLNSVQNVTFDVNSLATLIQGINKLGYKNITQATANLPIISKDLKQFITDLNGIGALNFDMTNLSALVTAISKLGGVASGRAITNIPALAKSLKDLFTTLSTAPNVSQNIINMTNALAQLAKSGSNAGKASNSLSKGLNSYSSSADKASKKSTNLTSAIGKFYAKFFLLIRDLKAFGNAVKATSDYVEAFNYFSVAFNKVGMEWANEFEKYGYENAESYAKSFSERMNESMNKLTGVKFDTENMRLASNEVKNLGLNIKEVTQYAAELAGVFNSAGLSGEATLAASNAFTKLAGDYSSLINVDYDTAAQNFRSGLTGMSRTLYKYGIDVTEARLKSEAYALGIKKSTTEMTQAEKMQLRMLAILKQSKIAWGDLSNTINQPANQMRVLKTQVSELSMLFGQLFVPILSKVIPVITGVVIALKRLMSTIAEFMGVKLGDASSYAIDLDNVSSGADNLSESLDDVTDSAKKAKAGLRGFDELNVISMSTTSTDGADGIGDIDLTDQILAMTDEYERVWQEAYNRMQSNAESFANTIQEIFGRVGNTINEIVSTWAMGFNFRFDTANLELAQQRIMGIGEQLHIIFGDKAVQNSASHFFDEFIFDLGRISADVINIGLSIGNNLLGGIEQYLTQNSERIKTYLVSMFDISTAISEIIGNIMDDISDIFTTVFQGENATNFTTSLLEMFVNPIMSIQTVLASLVCDSLNGVKTIIADNKAQITLAFDNLFGVLTSYTQPIADCFTSIGDGLLETYNTHIAPTIDRISETLSKITTTVLKLWNETVAPFLKESGDMIGELMEKYITPIVNDIVKFGGQIIEILGLQFEKLQPLFSFLAETFVPIIMVQIERLRAAAMFILEGIGNGIKTLMSILTGLMEFILGVMTGDLARASEGISKIFKAMGNQVISTFESIVNLIIRCLNSLNFNVPDWVPGIGGENIGFNLKTVTIPRFENGGYPKSADLFYANENGIPELVGTMGGKTAVASGTEITGIADAVYTTGQTEASLLQTAVGLLQVIAEKDNGISADAVFKSVQKSAKTYSQRTGKLAFE